MSRLNYKDTIIVKASTSIITVVNIISYHGNWYNKMVSTSENFNNRHVRGMNQ